MRAPYIRIVTSFFLALSMPCVVLANPPEGLDNFAIHNKGKTSSSLSPLVSYAKSAWISPYSTLEAVASTPLAKNLLTYGAKVNVGGAYGDRSSYLLRYDWIFTPTSSLSLKWSHEDWKYISTAKDSYGVEYNYFIAVGDRSGLYGSIGGYYRFLKQRWNKPWWSPFNFNTKDQEYYFTGALGWKGSLSETSYFTFDMNVRDTWSYYNFDNVAFDFNFYLGTGKNFVWRINGGVRTSAIWSGTMYPSQYYGGLGFVVF